MLFDALWMSFEEFYTHPPMCIVWTSVYSILALLHKCRLYTDLDVLLISFIEGLTSHNLQLELCCYTIHNYNLLGMLTVKLHGIVTSSPLFPMTSLETLIATCWLYAINKPEMQYISITDSGKLWAKQNRQILMAKFILYLYLRNQPHH